MADHNRQLALPSSSRRPYGDYAFGDPEAATRAIEARRVLRIAGGGGARWRQWQATGPRSPIDGADGPTHAYSEKGEWLTPYHVDVRDCTSACSDVARHGSRADDARLCLKATSDNILWAAACAYKGTVLAELFLFTPPETDGYAPRRGQAAGAATRFQCASGTLPATQMGGTAHAVGAAIAAVAKAAIRA